MADETASRPTHAPGRKTILLVEDEALIALSEQKTLEHHGYRVVRASTGEEAVERVGEGREIDLVLMDIDLGRGMDGTRAAERILAMRTIPVVFLTSHAEREMVERVKGITRYGYVLKSAGEFVLIESMAMAFELFETNRELQESRDRYRSVVRLSGEIVVQHALDHRRVFVNPNACAFWGRTEDELLGADLVDLVHPDDEAATRDAIEAMIRTNEPIRRLVNRQRTPDGWRIVEWNSAPITDEHGVCVGYQATGRDITERERSRRDVEAMSRALEAAANGIVFADFEGKIEYTNPAAREMWGYPDPDELVGRVITEFVRDRGELACIFAAAIRDGSAHGEFTAVRADGTPFEVELFASHVTTREGVPARIMGSVIDVSRRKRIETELRGYKQAADSAESMIVAIDRSHRYTLVNRSFLERYGLQTDQVIGAHASRIVGQELYENVLKPRIDACLRGETVTFDADREYPGIGIRSMSITYSPIRADGEITGLVGIFLDSTETRATQRRLTGQLARSHLLATIAGRSLQGSSAEEIASHAVAELARHFPALRVAYSTLDRDGIVRVLVSRQPDTMPDIADATVDVRRAEAYLSVLRSGAPFESSDVASDETVRPIRDLLVANRSLAVLDVPVVRSERLVGTLCLDAPEVHQWTDDERETLREVSRYLSLALTAQTVRQDLEDRTREWETLFDLIPDMLCVASTDGWFLKLNRSWERVLGYRREELLARPYAEFLHPDDVATTREEVERQSSGRQTVNFVNRYRTAEGDYRWLEWWTTPAIGNQVYAAARDITERRQQERRIRSLLSERDLIVREAHHRIKNDLNIVQSMLSLQARQNDSESARESLSVASRRVGAIARVYEKLQRTSDVEVVDASAFVPSVVSDVQSSSTVPGLRVDVDVEPVRLPSRLAVAVGIVTNELVTNAVKYAFAGVAEPEMRITGWSDGEGRFHLQVADNGVGMSAELLTGRGGGFGTAVVDALVSQHDGCIRREHDGGTVVRVSVPLARSETAQDETGQSETE